MKKHYISIIAGCFIVAGLPRVLADKPADDSSFKAPAQPDGADRDKDHNDDHDHNGKPGEGSPEQDPKDVAFQEEMTKENAKSQDYYGLVVDQYKNPVQGVKVTGTLMLLQGFDTATKKKAYTTTSDSNGQFQFTGLHGWELAVAVNKDGYEMDDSGNAFTAPNQEDRTSLRERAVFTMWKLKGAEPMAHCDGHCGLAVDGSGATRFDLLTGKKTISGGDLTVNFVRNPLNINRHHPFDWTLTLQIAGGGLILIPENSPYAYEAPTNGYQPMVTVSMSASDPKWSYSYRRTYYFNARNGQVYGRVTVDLMANYQQPTTHFEFEVYANPNNSRNLEFDREKQIKY